MAISHLKESGAEFFIHAGDIGETATLDLLKQSGKRYIAVYGNNDAHLAHYHNDYELVQEPYYFKLANTRFKLMHLPFYLTPDAQVVLFGHTHTFECDFKDKTLYLNPGETCARNKNLSECAMLEITDNGYRVTYFSRKRDEMHFHAQHFSFERSAS